MINKGTSSPNILKDLEEVYMLAMEKRNFTAALKAKELLGRACGLFSSSPQKSCSLADFSEEDLDHLIDHLNRQLQSNQQVKKEIHQ